MVVIGTRRAAYGEDRLTPTLPFWLKLKSPHGASIKWGSPPAPMGQVHGRQIRSGTTTHELAVEVDGFGGGFAVEGVELLGEFAEGGVDGCCVGGAVFEVHAESAEVFVAGDGLEAFYLGEACSGEAVGVAGESVQVARSD